MEMENANTGIKYQHFIIPSHVVKEGVTKRMVKNDEDRLVVLNEAAKAIIDKCED